MIFSLDIDTIWPVVADKIQAIADEYNEGWNAQNVYESLKARRSFLYLHTEGDGFVVVYPEQDSWTGELTMYIWIAWNDRSGASQETYLDQLNELAAGMGATRIVMETKRRGFERCGWDLQTIKYTRKVVPL